MKQLTVVAMMIGCLALSSTVAQAGLMDKINSAAQKINQKSQQMQNGQGQSAAGQDPDRPLTLDNKGGSSEGHRSATCMDYGEAVDKCMAPLRGYRMKLLGDRIDQKLKTEKLSDQDRKNLEEDLAGIREA